MMIAKDELFWAAFTRNLTWKVDSGTLHCKGEELRNLVKATTELRDITRECMNNEDYDEYFDGSRVETTLERVDDALKPFGSVTPALGESGE